MPLTEMIVTVAIVSALVLGFVALLRLWSTVIVHKTIRRAVETNPQLAESLLGKLTEPKERSGDDRLALILVAIGIAMGGATLIAIDDPGLIRAGLAAALFPLVVGGAIWLRFRAAERAKMRDGDQ